MNVNKANRSPTFLVDTPSTIRTAKIKQKWNSSQNKTMKNRKRLARRKVAKLPEALYASTFTKIVRTVVVSNSVKIKIFVKCFRELV